ncbi:MAG: carbohydrate ABC transporter permease [Christensenellaceae bacterium]|nr:carbohydrate ABC transporter permease [Christensenellaceae bacterium]
MKKRFKLSQIFVYIFVASIVVITLFPLVRTFSYSFFHPDEITGILKSRNNFDNTKWIVSNFTPSRFSLNQHYKIFIGDPAILKLFTNSVIYVSLILLGQALVIPALSFALAKLRFKGKNVLFFMIIVLMVLPFQVTMSPNILTLQKLGLLNSIWAIILPASFSPFYIFLLRQYMLNIPTELLEAAALDGRGAFGTFFYVALPVSKPIIGAAVSLSFADIWNMAEQPLAFLSNRQDLMPLSVMFNVIGDKNAEIAFAGAVLYILPALFVFFFFQKDITEGLQLSEMK